jgi:UDP-N-acetylmuramoyl-tripeptide--D-alanyl-D-alanine ligase
MQTLKEINKILDGEFFASTNVAIKNISIDTRTLQPGDLYIAIIGENTDGHKYIEQAKEKGAAAVVVSAEPNCDIAYIKVIDTLDALTALAKHKRDSYPIPAIAITGSCGKTTTRSIVQSILSRHGSTLASKKSYNNNIGVALTMLDLNSSYQYAVFELGANHPGEIAELTHLAKPTVAVITNAAPAHLEGFDSLDGVACAKSEIFQGLTEHGTAIINADDKYAKFWEKISGQHKKIFFSTFNKTNVYASDPQITDNGTNQFTLHINEQQSAVELPLLGEHNIANALAAAAACHALGVGIDTIAAGIAATANEAHRLVKINGIAGASIFDDTYNANPQSVAAAIDFLARYTGNTILVLGDMAELGANSKQLHTDIGQQARGRINKLYTFGDLSQHSSVAFGDRSLHFDSKQDLITHLCSNISSEQIILIKGSRSMQLEEVVTALTKE